MTKRRTKISTSEAYSEYQENESINKEFGSYKQVKLTDKQYDLFNGIKNTRISTIVGPPGASKTFTACWAALKALQRGEVKRIILVKPLETSGEDLGFLPG